MITKTGLEKLTEFFKIREKVNGSFSRLWALVGQLQLGCQFVLGSRGRSDEDLS